MKTYIFWIRRTHSSSFERIEVQATDSHDAVRKLQPCVYWDFKVLWTIKNKGVENAS